MTQLSEHFTFEELTHTDHRELDNTPTNAEKCVIDGKDVLIDAVANLPRLAAFLEQIKVVLGGKPIMVNSAFRSEAVNSAVGSKNTSDHRRGCAADIRVPGMTPDEVTKAIIASDLGYAQVIREFDRWTHVAIPTHAGDVAKKSKLIIDKQGTRPYA
jgi:zinc D-Ala-D-Ala carboxypeptidase